MLSTALFIPLVLVGQQAAAAQDQRETSVFIDQAPRSNDTASSVTSVYLEPSARTEGSMEERVSVEDQQLIDPQPERALDQLSSERGAGASRAEQLTRDEGRRALAQLTQADRQILMRAVSGSDICEQEPTLPAIIELCLQRIETRSAEFSASNQPTLSPEERLLGEGLDDDRVSTLERAVSRLARGQANLSSDEDQAVASVALGQGVLNSDPVASDQPSESDLSAETQALINAIVEQFSNPSGGI